MKRKVETKTKVIEIITYELSAAEVKEALREYLSNHTAYCTEEERYTQAIMGDRCELHVGEFDYKYGAPAIDVVNFYEKESE
ncbi:MAG: hypothetical protein DRO67_06435 [Candidatus Asgardarchaeum californiense]|nr:MAG: hypothetical protein DRO67_06435 [Candidatus Asgardarchaeum californiense]